MTTTFTRGPQRCSAFALNRASRSSRPAPSPPSITCLENFSLPGLLIVTTHLDLLNSSDANNLVSFDRAAVATAVAEVTDGIWLPPCWCGSSAYQLRPPSTRIGSFSGRFGGKLRGKAND